jgi:WhiB family redox-sensing transcriptional regulator
MIELGERPAWHDEAACHDRTDLFFPDRFTHASKLREARQICQTCPVRKACLDYSLTLPHPWHGIYAGLSPKQRQQIKGDNRANFPT